MRLIHHTCVGTNDFENGSAFYKAVLAPLGAEVINQVPGKATMFGTEGAPEFFVLTPSNGEAATFSNGGTYGFNAESRAQVDAFHAAGMANGGSDEGAPGPRGFAPDAYAAYLRDPDGNKICAVCFAAQ